jgi:hypothetical protein
MKMAGSNPGHFFIVIASEAKQSMLSSAVMPG